MARPLTNKTLTAPTLTTPTISDALQLTAGAMAAAVALRLGGTATEGLEVSVIDETLDLTALRAKFKALTNTIPAGSVILAVQANIEAAVTAGGTTVKIAVGLNGGDLDKYGQTSDWTHNQKIDTIPNWTVLSGAEQLDVCGVITGGSAPGDTDISAGSVRVPVAYLTRNSLDNA